MIYFCFPRPVLRLKKCLIRCYLFKEACQPSSHKETIKLRKHISSIAATAHKEVTRRSMMFSARLQSLRKLLVANEDPENCDAVRQSTEERLSHGMAERETRHIGFVSPDFVPEKGGDHNN